MYLTRMFLNPRSKRVQAEIKSPYEMHRTLSKGFIHSDWDKDKPKILFRIDSDHQKLILYVQSSQEPDWNFLVNEGKYLLRQPGVKSFDPVLNENQLLKFRLRANPTVKRDGKRFGIIKLEEQLNWLERKAEASGFIFDKTSILVKDEGFKSSLKRSQKNPIIHLSVCFDGVLQIKNSDQFKKSLESGLGSAKSFGFGMLSIAPA